jgi:hypothetical protein
MVRIFSRGTVRFENGKIFKTVFTGDLKYSNLYTPEENSTPHNRGAPDI